MLASHLASVLSTSIWQGAVGAADWPAKELARKLPLLVKLSDGEGKNPHCISIFSKAAHHQVAANRQTMRYNAIAYRELFSNIEGEQAS